MQNNADDDGDPEAEPNVPDGDWIIFPPEPQ